MSLLLPKWLSSMTPYQRYLSYSIADIIRCPLTIFFWNILQLPDLVTWYGLLQFPVLFIVLSHCMSWDYRSTVQMHEKLFPFSESYNSLSQTSFSQISINSLTILMVSMAPESPWKDLSINTSHVSKQSIMAEILGRSTSNHYGTIY